MAKGGWLIVDAMARAMAGPDMSDIDGRQDG